MLKEMEKGMIKQYHVHSHYLLRRSISFALHLKLYQVTVMDIQKISGGILVAVKLKDLRKEQVTEFKSKLVDRSMCFGISK